MASGLGLFHLAMWANLLLLFTVAGKIQEDLNDQLNEYKANNNESIPIMTTSAGAPVNSIDATLTINRPLIFNEHFMDLMSHFNRERIPERVVHAKGSGAFGYFEVTDDLTDICKAKLFDKVGKRTPVAVRFSTVVGETGSADTVRDIRGFAVKFYTEEGNFDIPGFSIPIFGLKDPILFASFNRAIKRNPATGLHDTNMLWDYASLHPEVLHAFMYLFSDHGLPKGFRHMNGYGVHTYQVVNEDGDTFFTRFAIEPEAGFASFSPEEALKLAGEDPDYARRDLYTAIQNGDYPAWVVSVQVLTERDIRRAGFDVFDVTMFLPEDKYPLRPVGRIVLNRNPSNYFAEIDQLAFCPGNLVPGILGSPDKMFEARRFSYRDAALYRLGTNFNKITVNSPIHDAHTYNRDGVAPVKDNELGAPVYYPNSFNGPVAYTEENRVELIEITEDAAVNNFDQIRDLYKNIFTDEMRSLVLENILFTLKPTAEFIQKKSVTLLKHLYLDLGVKVERGLYNMTSN